MDNTEGQQQQITFEEFLKVQLKVGRVIQAENIPGMKKIIKVKVDLGLEEREIVVGAALYYKPEELIGQVLIVCTNLEPRKIEMSFQMECYLQLMVRTENHCSSPSSEIFYQVQASIEYEIIISPHQI